MYEIVKFKVKYSYENINNWNNNNISYKRWSNINLMTFINHGLQ